METDNTVALALGGQNIFGMNYLESYYLQT